jgi:hypothetical protein
LHRYATEHDIQYRYGAMVGLYNLNPVDPWLERGRFQPLNLSSDIPVSKFDFKRSLQRYTVAALLTNAAGAPERSILTGSACGLLDYVGSNIDVGVALRARVPLLDGDVDVLVRPSLKTSPLPFTLRAGTRAVPGPHRGGRGRAVVLPAPLARHGRSAAVRAARARRGGGRRAVMLYNATTHVDVPHDVVVVGAQHRDAQPVGLGDDVGSLAVAP